MTKDEAIQMFGGGAEGTQRLADTLEITRQAIYQWADELPLWQADRVMGAALRMGLVGRGRRLKQAPQ